MSYLKFGSDEFLETLELKRFKKFLVDEGHKAELLANTALFGIIKNDTDSLFNDFKVVPGTNANTVKIKTGKAVDLNGNIITLNEDVDNVLIPNQTNKYWLFIRHRFDPREVGTVSVNTDGTLTGVGTKFTEVLRGINTRFPIKIKFTNAVTNTGEYTITDVIDDTNAVLNVASGVLASESDLKYSVIGSFTEGYVVPEEDKQIYQYDGCQLNDLPLDSPDVKYVVEAILNTQPDKLSPEDIFIARVWRDSDTNELIIEDKRNEIWTTQAEYKMSFLQSLTNETSKIVGVESVKWLPIGTTREYNEVNIGWGFRSTVYTVNSTLNKVTIQNGQGGWYKSNNAAATGAFNGMRFYWNNGEYSKIISSTKVGSTHELILEKLDMSNYSLGTEVFIVPNVESIEIRWNPLLDTETYIIRSGRKEFNIENGEGKIYLYAYPITPKTGTESFNTYELQFRFKNGRNYSDWFNIQNSNEYYIEKAFNSETGVLTDVTQKRTINDSQIIINKNINSILINDKKGVFDFQITDTSPVVELFPAQIEDKLIIRGNATLDDDLIFVLKDEDNGSIIGNKFIIYYQNTVNLNSHNMVFKLNTSGGTTIQTFTVDQLGGGEVYIECLRIPSSPYWKITIFKPANSDYQEFSALITQNGTNNPVLTIQRDTLGLTSTLTAIRTTAGGYAFSNTVDIFDENCQIIVTPMLNITFTYAYNCFLQYSKVNKKIFTIQTYVQNPTIVPLDTLLKDTPLIIKKFN